MFKNNKGFSMVELLAVIVILGVVSTVGIAAVVRLVNYSRENYYKVQNKNLIMAAQAYANDERSILPKEIGGISKVYLKDLTEKKYIKEDILDQSKRKCDADLSYVSIIKKNKTDYNYVGYLNCPACVQKGNSDGYCQTASEEVPTASVSLSTGTLTIDGKQEEQIKMAEGALVMQGNADGTKELYSYSYKVYSNGVLKYNSGTKRIKGNSLSISINNVLSENVPGNIKVTLTVTNEDGYSKTVSNSKNYNDIVDPHCGAITGQPNTVTRGGNVVCADDSWTRGTRDIMITCNDFQGSGCKQREFSTHFTNESGPNGTDTIEIEDVSGKKTSCTVFPCIDRTPPSITVKVYKRIPSQTTASYYTNNATAIKEFTVSTNDTTVKDVGWFNKSYADGVFFVITSTDSGIIKSYKAQYNDYGKYGTEADNDTNIYKHNSSYNSNSVNSKEITKTTYLDAEGRRYIKFTVVDGAGNVASMALRVEIDKTEPTIDNNQVVNFQTENEVKYNLKLTKYDETSRNALADVKFSVNGGGYINKIFATNSDGILNINGLIPGTEYTLKETEANGYYIRGDSIVFKVERNGENLELNVISGQFVDNPSITTNNESARPTINIDYTNEKVPTYDLVIQKYREGTTDPVENVKFVINGPTVKNKVYETDAQGKIYLEGLYLYDPTRDQEATYTLRETYAPEGFEVITDPIEFSISKDGDNLVVNSISNNELPYEFDQENNKFILTIPNRANLRIIKTDKDTGEPMPNVEFYLFNEDDEGFGEDSQKTFVEKEMRYSNNFNYNENTDEYTLEEGNTYGYADIMLEMPEGGTLEFEWIPEISDSNGKLTCTIRDDNYRTIYSKSLNGIVYSGMIAQNLFESEKIQLPEGSYTVEFNANNIDQAIIKNLKAYYGRNNGIKYVTDENGKIN